MARSRVDPSCLVSRVARGVFVLALASFGVFVPAAVAVRPGNDNFADAAALEGLPISVVASNEGATREPGEPDHGVSYSASAGSSLWWRWVAPRSGPFAVGACGTDLIPALGVYTGEALSELTSIGGSNYRWGVFAPWCRDGRPFARVVFFATVGEVYRIAADHELFNLPQPGERADATFRLELRPAAIVGMRLRADENGAIARLVYRAATGEENGGQISLAWDQGQGTLLPEPPRAPVAFAVSEQLVPGVGCTIPVLTFSVSCAIPAGSRPAGPLVMLGDRDDSVSVEFSRRGTEIFGGSGDDTISASGDIYGGPGDDEIEGRLLGRSNIRGGPGDDTITGGRRPDVIDPGPGEDRVGNSPEHSGARDLIRTRDSNIDYIFSCGPRTTALIDGLDSYPDNCGRVERAGAARAIPAFYGSGEVELQCPPDAPRFCAGSFSVSAGVVHLHRNFRLRRGDQGSSNSEFFDLGATPAQLRVLERRPVKVTVRTRYPTGRIEQVTTTFAPRE